MDPDPSQNVTDPEHFIQVAVPDIVQYLVDRFQKSTASQRRLVFLNQSTVTGTVLVNFTYLKSFLDVPVLLFASASSSTFS